MAVSTGLTPLQNELPFDCNNNPWLFHSHSVPRPPTAYHWHGSNMNGTPFPLNNSAQTVVKPDDTVISHGGVAIKEEQPRELRGSTKHARNDEEKSKTATKAKRRKSMKVSQSNQNDRYLERNRQAAERCRQRKKVYEADLEQHARELERNNVQLNFQASFLQGEVLNLKTECLKHTNCDCDRIRDYLMKSLEVAVAATKALADPLSSPTVSPTSTQWFNSSRRESMSTDASSYLNTGQSSLDGL